MALIIRMRQQGANGQQHFRIVLTDGRAPRDGKYVEKLGWYNPMGKTNPNYQLDLTRIEHWLQMGAEMSERVRALVKRASPEIVQKLGQKKVAKMAKARAKKKASAKATANKK